MTSVVYGSLYITDIKQLLDEVEHDIMIYQNRGLCYLPKPKASAAILHLSCQVHKLL